MAVSTTYYLKPEDPCPCCKRPYEPAAQIGVSAAGWEFSFDPLPSGETGTLERWLPLMRRQGIVDEYDKVHSVEDFVALVERKKGGRKG